MGCGSTKQAAISPKPKEEVEYQDASTRDASQNKGKDLSASKPDMSLDQTQNHKLTVKTQIHPDVHPNQEQKPVGVQPVAEKTSAVKEEKREVHPEPKQKVVVPKDPRKQVIASESEAQQKEVKEETKPKKESKIPQKEEPIVKTEEEIIPEETEIYTNFKKLGIATYDEIFTKVSLLLTTAEKVRSSIEGSKQKSISLSNTFLLKEYSLLETVRVLLWAVSANYKGKIADAGIQTYTEAPFMKLPQLKKMMDEAQELYNEFAKYLKSVTESTEAVKNIEETLTQLSDQAKSLVQKGHEEIEGSYLGEEEKKKIKERLNRYAENYLPNELRKTKRLIPLIQKEMEEMASIAPQLQELLAQADEVGAKVHLEYTDELKNATDSEQIEDIQFMLSPARIFNVYSNKDTKSPSEVEAHLNAVKQAEDNALKARIARERKDKD